MSGSEGSQIEVLQESLRAFASDRDWEQFHNPKNLVMALTAEVGELVELFQWLTLDSAASIMNHDESAVHVREEMADVFIYLLRLADELGVDLEQAVHHKLELNHQKYPIELARGTAKKYTTPSSPGLGFDLSAFGPLTAPTHLVSRDEFYTKPCPVPALAGIYGWWFDQVPGGFEVGRCETMDDSYLLYIGICPKQPPKNGKVKNQRTLRDRIREHFGLNAEGSTLRLTLGCLLAGELDLQLRRVGSGKRLTFTRDGENRLSDWMRQHARVSWLEIQQPWTVESELLHALDLPLNLDQNKHNAFHAYLTQLRNEAKQSAWSLPVVS